MITLKGCEEVRKKAIKELRKPTGLMESLEEAGVIMETDCPRIQKEGRLLFRSLSETENKIVAKVFVRTGKSFRDSIIRTCYVQQNNFTICVVLADPPASVLYYMYGVSKRNPEADEHNEQRAMDIALYRALTSNAFLYK